MDGGAITGDLTVTLGDQLRARWHQGTKYLMAAVAVFLAATTFRAIPTFPDDYAWEIAIVIFVMSAVVAAFLVLIWGILAVATALRFLLAGKAQRSVTYSFDANGFTVRDRRAMALTVPWTAVRDVRETRRALLLRMKPAGLRYLPLRAFAPDDLKALRALMSQKLGGRARWRKA